MANYPVEHQSQVAQISASRDAEIVSRNAARLENWQLRLSRDPVKYDPPAQPPKWPVQRASIAVPNVSKLERKRA